MDGPPNPYHYIHFNLSPKLAQFIPEEFKIHKIPNPNLQFKDPEELYLKLDDIKFQNSVCTISGIYLVQNETVLTEIQIENCRLLETKFQCNYHPELKLYSIYLETMNFTICFEKNNYQKESKIVFSNLIVFDCDNQSFGSLSNVLIGKLKSVCNNKLLTFDKNGSCIRFYTKFHCPIMDKFSFSSTGFLNIKSAGVEENQHLNFVAKIFGEEHFCCVSENLTQIYHPEKTWITIPKSVLKIEFFTDFIIIYCESETFYITLTHWIYLKWKKLLRFEINCSLLKTFTNDPIYSDPYYYTEALSISNSNSSFYVLKSTNPKHEPRLDIYQFIEDRLVMILDILSFSKKHEPNSKVELCENGNIIVYGKEISQTFKINQ